MRYRGLAVLIFSLLISVTLVFSPLLKAARVQGLRLFEEFYMLRQVFSLIGTQYVDEAKVDKEKLLYGAIDGAIKTLEDPFTRFMKPEAFDNMQTEASGEFGGLGILISTKDDILTVIAPIEGTPAYHEGVQAGDRILKVDDKPTQGMSVNDAVKILRGPVGSKVVLGIHRIGERKIIDYTITRAIIKVSSVKARMVDEHIGYAHLSGFIQTSGQDLEKEISRFEKEHDLKGLILDVRNNPGGLLDAAVEVSRIFLGKSKIVSIKSRKGEEVTYSSFAQEHKKFPVIVLINRGSASASEIVAGAIHDNKRGILLGEKTFGKGSVQTVLPLPNKSAIALTTAYYYTPSGICIHKKGIKPQIPVALPRLTDDEIKELRSEREKELTDTAEQKGFMNVSKFDTQLAAAVDILRASDIFYDQILNYSNNPAVTADSSVQSSQEKITQ
jgi:carboxyl-terminal processing protease